MYVLSGSQGPESPPVPGMGRLPEKAERTRRHEGSLGDSHSKGRDGLSRQRTTGTQGPRRDSSRNHKSFSRLRVKYKGQRGGGDKARPRGRSRRLVKLLVHSLANMALLTAFGEEGMQVPRLLHGPLLNLSGQWFGVK